MDVDAHRVIEEQRTQLSEANYALAIANAQIKTLQERITLPEQGDA